uniref:Uncharacterized protein n=1 Tax=viral metagenome TaxID=1070528 RepID=A0A6C0I8A2_9ZZZZ
MASVKKPSPKLLLLCKKLKVRVTVKRGTKRVYKSSAVLVKQCKAKLKKLKKGKKVKGKSVCNKLSESVCGSKPNCKYTKRGCVSRKGTRTGKVVYEGPTFDGRLLPVPEKAMMPYSIIDNVMVPTQTKLKLDFGLRKNCRKGYRKVKGACRKVKPRYNVKDSVCNRKSRKVCKSMPNCTYTLRGCRRRKGTRGDQGLVYEGPSLQGYNEM